MNRKLNLRPHHLRIFPNRMEDSSQAYEVLSQTTRYYGSGYTGSVGSGYTGTRAPSCSLQCCTASVPSYNPFTTTLYC